MGGVTNQTNLTNQKNPPTPSTTPLAARSRTGEVPDPLPTATPGPVSPPKQGDRLQTPKNVAAIASEPDHTTLAERVRLLKAEGDRHPIADGLRQTYDQTTRPAVHKMEAQVSRVMNSPGAKRAEARAHHAGGVLAFVGNVLNGLVASPEAVIGKVQGVLYGGHGILSTSNKAQGLVQAFAAARRNGHGLNFVRGQFKSLRLATGSKLAATWRDLKTQKGMFFVRRMAAKNLPAVAAEASSANKGVLGFYRLARAEGAGPFRALGRAFGQTVETGGSMPTIAADAAKVGGRWGKAMVWAGRFGRIAPLLNVPLAAFDLVGAVKTWRNPRSTTQEKVSKTGCAALSTAAAGLAIAGLLTPPPVYAALFVASGVAGLASGIWGLATSKAAFNLYHKVGETASNVGHAVGGFFSGVGHRIGHLFGG